MKTEPNESIKPLTGSAGYPLDKSEVYNEPNEKMCIGLTKREYFAAMAMQGMLVNGGQTEHAGKTYAPQQLASLAANQADALIAELNKQV